MVMGAGNRRVPKRNAQAGPPERSAVTVFGRGVTWVRLPRRFDVYRIPNGISLDGNHYMGEDAQATPITLAAWVPRKYHESVVQTMDWICI